VKTDGTVGEVRFIRSTGCSKADEVFVEHLRTWRFRPAVRDGRPLEAEYVVGINLGD
jgi:hypothetical protein